jgi:hypothetical protein
MEARICQHFLRHMLPSPFCYTPDTGEGGVEDLYFLHQLGGPGHVEHLVYDW